MEYARPATRLGTVSPLCSQPVTSRSMKTVQRSPSRVGQARGQRQPGEFALDADAQLLRLLLQERSGAGGAGFVHGEIHHHAVLDGDELGILPADLEDGVHRLAAQRAG